ncbi:protein phosphatase [Fistulifera solaris]|uniref:protein-serine/threonine phosphatase n=1 Tax=Fistulifera solaris TaxID=1519565 RepID=A0A1Z5J5U6_FISSO|nr:protein phosphatase [Fistulifera solaris]|eukprot:GAX09309.1 protein phosphatase [Fistulifera solaris]
MGTYLSTPVTEKCSESGQSIESDARPVAWSVADMQGWRKTMEDAHLACLLNDYKVFGVFDGHGGPEVARFCSLYLVSVLQQHLSSRDTDNMGLALVQTFHALDRMIHDAHRRDELVQLRSMKPAPGLRKTAVSIPENGVVVLSDTSLSSSSPLAAETCSENENSKDDDGNDSDGVVGREEAAALDRNLDDSEHDTDSNTDNTCMKTNQDDESMTAMFKRLLNLTGQTSATSGTLTLDDANKKIKTEASSFRASMEQNGRLICTLPDHPIHAGATAIVAVLEDNGLLTVANAGDSRAVLCRAHGQVEALSEDHKPMQATELARIVAAGGFVNAFGRVNGNLNLSRSIGDLKYKQVPYLSPAEQMNTAEPDIRQIQIELDDEFILLGCDGIWDCMTNEKAVAYVRSRLDTCSSLNEICTQLLDDILSIDPRVTQGIGGDNMTLMIVDLQPQKRMYFALNNGDEDPILNVD